MWKKRKRRKMRRKRRCSIRSHFIEVWMLRTVYFFDTVSALFQVQPLSLEELLAKKKAAEEAESKVKRFFLYLCKCIPLLLYFLNICSCCSPSSCLKQSEKLRPSNGGSSWQRNAADNLTRRGRNEEYFRTSAGRC